MSKEIKETETAAVRNTKPNSSKPGNRKPGRQRRQQRSRNSRVNAANGENSNSTLTRMTVSTPVSQSAPSLVFPTDSAAMMSAGNYITTAGQENFLEDFTRIRNGADVPTFTVYAGMTAKRTPNIMRLDFMPQFGATGTSRSFINPLTQAALNLKQYIDTSFGTNTNYEPQDLMLYLMAVSACFPLIAEIKRNLRLLYTTIPNTYPAFVPRGVYTMLHLTNGTTFADGAGAMYTAEHLRQWIDKLNQVLLLFNQLPKPPEITAFGYNDVLFDAIYADSADITTAQLYVFASTGYWLYDDEYNESGAGVTPQRWYPSSTHDPGRTVNEMIDALYSQVRNLSNLRTDSSAMLQNLFNAYGSKDTVQVELMDYNSITPVPIVYNEQMLIAIENANICGDYVEWSAYSRETSDSTLGETISGAPFLRIGESVNLSPIFNLPLQFHKPAEQITKDDIGWALRFHTTFLTHDKITVFYPGSEEGIEVEGMHSANACGFGMITGIHIGTLSDTGYLAERDYTNRSITDPSGPIMLNDFAYAPILVHYTQSGTASAGYEFTLDTYSAHRDVEVTYRLEDITMHWTYLTQTVWGANVNRNVSGSRK